MMYLRNILFTISFILWCIIGNAQQNTNSKPADSAHGTLQAYRQLFWDSLPQPSSWTNDYEDLYTDAQQNKLDSIIAAFKKETGIELCIVTLDTNYVADENFDELALHIANVWGVGEKDKNDGVTICISKGYRRMRICNGFGIEKVMTDAETKQMIDNYFIPAFKQADYYKGTYDGLLALINVLRDRAKKIQ